MKELHHTHADDRDRLGDIIQLYQEAIKNEIDNLDEETKRAEKCEAESKAKEDAANAKMTRLIEEGRRMLKGKDDEINKLNRRIEMKKKRHAHILRTLRAQKKREISALKKKKEDCDRRHAESERMFAKQQEEIAARHDEEIRKLNEQIEEMKIQHESAMAANARKISELETKKQECEQERQNERRMFETKQNEMVENHAAEKRRLDEKIQETERNHERMLNVIRLANERAIAALEEQLEKCMKSLDDERIRFADQKREMKERHDVEKKQLEEIKERLENELSITRDTIARLTEQLEQSRKAFDELKRDHDAKIAELVESQKRVVALEADLAAKEKALIPSFRLGASHAGFNMDSTEPHAHYNRMLIEYAKSSLFIMGFDLCFERDGSVRTTNTLTESGTANHIRINRNFHNICYVPIAMVLCGIFGVELPADMLNQRPYESFAEIPEDMDEYQYVARMRAFLFAHRDDELFNTSVAELISTFIELIDVSSFVTKGNLDRAAEFFNVVHASIHPHTQKTRDIHRFLARVSNYRSLNEDERVTHMKKCIQGLYALIHDLHCTEESDKRIPSVFHLEDGRIQFLDDIRLPGWGTSRFRRPQSTDAVPPSQNRTCRNVRCGFIGRSRFAHSHRTQLLNNGKRS
jgi:hypothetical protein